MTEPDPRSPLSADEAAALFRAVLREDDGVCLLAVSGGPDSTAMMALAAEVAAGFAPLRFVVATVDHGLRAASGAEAEAALARARALGLEARLLRWAPATAPARGLQQAAREARYRLLLDCAGACGARALMTAHNLDDQAETVLMRLAAGSGLDGLAGMAARSPLAGIDVARPFLAIPKSRLVATCRARGLAFAEDPTNRDPAYARPRLRAAAPALASEGLSPARLARLARRAAASRDALEEYARRARARALLAEGEGGAVALDGRSLAREPFEILLRVVGRAIVDVTAAAGDEGGDSGRDSRYGPRLARLEALCEALAAALAQGAPMPGRTLGGARVAADAEGRVSVSRAPSRRAGAARKPQSWG